MALNESNGTKAEKAEVLEQKQPEFSLEGFKKGAVVTVETRTGSVYQFEIRELTDGSKSMLELENAKRKGSNRLFLLFDAKNPTITLNESLHFINGGTSPIESVRAEQQVKGKVDLNRAQQGDTFEFERFWKNPQGTERSEKESLEIARPENAAWANALSGDGAPLAVSELSDKNVSYAYYTSDARGGDLVKQESRLRNLRQLRELSLPEEQRIAARNRAKMGKVI